MGNGMNKVMPGLYVGNYRDSKDASQLEKFNITHILSIHDTAKRLYPEKHYLCILAADIPSQNLIQYFPVCNDFIHSARLRDGNVLIHCLAGMSRSVTITVAYIMSVTNLNWKDALKVVRVGRAVANPNSGFQKQLQEFENYKLGEERLRLKERFPSAVLVAQDECHCQKMLNSYQKLVIAKHLCEGNCPNGEICPTGICNLRHKRVLRKNSMYLRTSDEVPSTSKSKTASLRRPQSGPAVLVSSSSSFSSRMPSVQSLPDLESKEKLTFKSAPSSPQRFLQQKRRDCNIAPLVDLDELID